MDLGQEGQKHFPLPEEKHESWLLEDKEMVAWWRRSGMIFLGEGTDFAKHIAIARHGMFWKG